MPRVVHFEIPANDPERASRFYAETFGWRFRKAVGPREAWLLTTASDARSGADGRSIRATNGLGGTLNTIDVDALDEYVRRVEANGGSVVEPKMAVPGVGWFAYCRDPEDNVFGLTQLDGTAA